MEVVPGPISRGLYLPSERHGVYSGLIKSFFELVEESEQVMLEEKLLLLKLDVKINVNGASSRAVRRQRLAKITRSVVVVGASNVGRLADVVTFNWKPDPEAVKAPTTAVEDAVKKTDPDGAIYHADGGQCTLPGQET